MQTFQEQVPTPDILSNVRIGTPVFDRLNRRVGTVETVLFGNQSREVLSSKLSNSAYISQDVQELLIEEGCIQVDSGFQWHDLYVTPEQITRISNDRIQLRVGRSNLIAF